MDTTLLAAIALGFFMGMEHATDADHVVAVSTIVSQSRNPLRAAVVGVSWGMGHTITLALVGAPILILGLTIPPRLELAFEFMVGIVLVTLGVLVVRDWWRKQVHAHMHPHPATAHPHFHAHQENPGHGHEHRLRLELKPMVVGMFHGLAGSAALMLLVLSQVGSAAAGVAYIAIFGLGSIGGMLFLSTLIGLPFAITARNLSGLNRWIQAAAGVASIALGLVVMGEIGLAQGLFAL